MSGIFRWNREPTWTKSGPSQLLSWSFWREYTANGASYAKCAEDGNTIHKLTIEHVYKKRKQVGLWWWATVPSKTCPKPTIRHHHARAIRNAFVTALKEKGFQKDGTKAVGAGKMKAPLEELQGSLQVFGNAKILDAKFVDLEKECRDIVDHVIKLQRGDGNGRPGRSYLRMALGRGLRSNKKRVNVKG